MQQRDPSPPPAERGKRRSLFGSRPGNEEVGSSDLLELSRDQAISALIARSDERFEALTARTDRLEDTMNQVAESVRAAREQIERSADALAGSPDSAVGIGQVSAQLDEMTRQVATAFRTLSERDQAIMQTVQERIREHGELIARETARIAEVMEAYVQQGVQAMGQLAGSADSNVEMFSHQEEEVSDRVRQIVEQQMSELGEQMQLLYDRVAIAATSLHELVASLGDRMTIESREAGSETREAMIGATRQMTDETRDVVLDAARAAATAVNRTIEGRVSGLAHLVRADSEAIREELVRRTAAFDEVLATALDERLASATDQMLEVMDRNMIRMVDALETHFDRLSAQVGERAATSVDLAIGARFDDVLARLHASSEVIERSGSEVRTVVDERLAAWDEKFASLDGRFAALAKLTRSDSEAIASQVLADQEVSKQALRATKELQASLPSEVIQMVEQRFASLAESIERSNEMLAHRIDRMAESLGQRQNDDIQVVIDRMGDAMHALASLGKGAPERATAVEID